MSCENKLDCPCTKQGCANHGKCCDCIKHHRDMDGVPFCIFPKLGDKSNRAYYEVLKERFGNGGEMNN